MRLEDHDPRPLDPETDPLGRAWALTRPAEPSAEGLDAFWLEASRRIDLASAAPAPRLDGLSRRRPPMRRLLVGFAAAQAAALLVGVGLLGLARGPKPELAGMPDRDPERSVKSVGVGNADSPAPIRIEAEVGETKIVRFDGDGDGHRVDTIDEASGDPGPLPTTSLLADVTQHEVFNGMESIGTP